MTEITTLSQFLTTAKTQFQVYELGRRVQHIDMLAFHQIESLVTPYPYPIQGHAQFAIVFWNESQQHFIWFLKLPLDEQGLLSPAPRSQFIEMVLTALGQDPTQPLTDEQQDRLANNPFSFKPSQEKLAVFNALVRKQLGLSASIQYEFAVQYLSGQIAPSEWQHIGLQGLSDVCVRLGELDHEQQLLASFDNSAIEVQIALCQCLEHLHLTEGLANKLYAKFVAAPPEYQAYYLRALASHTELSQQALAHLQQTERLEANELISIAGRNWTVLKQELSRSIYLEALARQPQAFFNQIFADIVAIPSLRNHLLGELRNPNRSVQLSQAIGGLFKATSK
ncbi:DUF3549 family protein [Shewanella decolorationis]|uniref:DUF3549 domain-containing protein n=1 Tax=Shewanella decolorationis S12 TaxID=1353536 RepID=A0ABP2Z308_9GAMM|nr:DUF3549 family protein [Shewanella decolorationis]ESE40825.1 hypothetical protein SHD_2382 [Shewanella decolorationis S12]GLR30899.1 hypothetical protein GCM10007922_04560 [Shewanella decolorationis]